MKMARNSSYVEIIEKIRQELTDYKECTGVSTSRLLRGRRHEKPKGLDSAIINSVLSGKTKRMRKATPRIFN